VKIVKLKIENFHKMHLVGPKEVKSLKKPKSNSHKGDNGILVIIGGSKQYHGAPLLAAKMASKIVDLVYFSSVPENNRLINKMKSKLCEFITVSRKNILSYFNKSDVILIGLGLGTGNIERNLINRLLKKYPHKKFVLDAGALKVLNKKYLGKNCIITPHAREFQILFKIRATEANVKQMAKKYQCVIVLKGKKDLIISSNMVSCNTSGNQGMTKGGTGAVLAGLIAALATTNNLYLAACAGTYLNGLAGNRLKKKVSYYYNASDLIEEIPKTIKAL